MPISAAAYYHDPDTDEFGVPYESRHRRSFDQASGNIGHNSRTALTPDDVFYMPPIFMASVKHFAQIDQRALAYD